MAFESWRAVLFARTLAKVIDGHDTAWSDPEDASNDRHTFECLERAVECVVLAESGPDVLRCCDSTTAVARGYTADVA